MVIRGIVTKGKGTGAYFVKIYSHKFKPLLKSFHTGTINIMVKEHILSTFKKHAKCIRGFEKGGKRFGDVFYVKGVVKGNPCLVLLPKNTTHKNILELLCKKINIKEGEMLEVIL